ncbi:putative origin recognition complex subunit 2 [Plasmodium gaboni]|uniref:Putative origin recognition complex subunit 2 n=1 Tax=Plasmodium gaboni TaxID=647221 RepID=A0A151LQ43_9APIC|nr:putative origin recognition complex subunit 2 [Plasmodium gaboni]KYO01219.1 putative origin recognition complex subunit 2 [Plasmodium gaboni]
MMKNFEVNSPKKLIRTIEEETNEEDKEEYLITNLTENNKNMPSVFIRIPRNLNKFLSNEETTIKYNENIKSSNNKMNKEQKLTSFKMDNKYDINSEEKISAMDNIVLDSTYQSDSTHESISFFNKINEQNYTPDNINNENENNNSGSNDDSDDDSDNYSYDHCDYYSDDDNPMDESLLKSFKNKYVDIYESNVANNEYITFIKNHTKNELEHFLQRRKLHHTNEMKVNDIINIDYDKLNEKNIIPYFLTNVFDMEQKKKREKMKLELEKKRKILAEKRKTKNKVEDKGKGKNDTTINEKKKKRNENDKVDTKKSVKNSTKVGNTQKGIKEGKMKTENYNDNDNSYDEYEDEEDDEYDDDNSYESKNKKNKKNKTNSSRNQKIKEDNEESYSDSYNDEFDKEDIDINIYNDPTLYGIEGSSDYSEDMKSDADNNTQEDDTGKEQLTNNNSKTPKKKKGKKNIDEKNSDEEEKLEDIVDASTQRLISYDYYSSLNIKEIVKPNNKIKSLSSYIPIEENLDNLDHIQKLQYLIKNLPYTHIKEKRSLYHYNIKQFIKWKVYLLNNINICLYGIGSKFHLLNLFTNICLNDGNKCIILGFEDEINFEEILVRILEYHYKYKSSKTLKSFDLLYELIQRVNDSNVPLYFIIHNLDNTKLYPYYEYFSFLSQYENIYFVCSIDDVSFELNMNFKNISSINFFYIKCHTWLDYRHEILRQWNKFLPEWVFNKKCEEIDIKKNIETILNALSINHKRLFKIIASIQLENLDKGIYGVEKESLLQDKRIFTVGASSIRINSLLVEFVSHNVITETRLKEGNTFLKINADKEELKRISEEL